MRNIFLIQLKQKVECRVGHHSDSNYLLSTDLENSHQCCMHLGVIVTSLCASLSIQNNKKNLIITIFEA